MKRFMSGMLAVLIFLTGVSVGLYARFSPATASAQAGCQTFPETGKTVCGRFLQYWQQHGGLAQQGLPLSGEFTEVNDLDGKTYTVQYFERAVFEKHPENQPPYDVLLSQLGTFQFKRKYPNGDPTGQPPAPAATATPVPAKPTATPIPDIHHQTVDFPGRSGSKFRGVVTEVRETKTIPVWSISNPRPANGKYVVVFLQVTNLGQGSAATDDTGLKMLDTQGRIFDAVDDFDVWYSAAKNWGGALYLDNLQPGVPTRMIFIFDIPADDAPYWLSGTGQ